MDNQKSSFIFFILLFCTWVLLVNIVQANEIDKQESSEPVQELRNAQLVRNSSIYQQATNQSPIVSNLLAEQIITVHQRKRAWYFIATDDKITGWLNMLDVRFNGVGKRTAELGVVSAFTSLSKNTQPTQSTGIRGFDEAELKKAKANFEQLAIVKTYSSTKKSVTEFAKQGLLSVNKAVKVK